MAESLSNKVKSEHVGRFESCKQLANPVKGRMEESYRIDSGVRASAFSFFLLVQSVSLLVPHYLLDNLFPFQQSRSLPNPFGSLDTSQAIPWALSSSVSALKYLLNLDEARKSRTRRVCEKGTSKRQLREMPRLFLFIPLLHLSSFSFFSLPCFLSFFPPFFLVVYARCRLRSIPLTHCARTIPRLRSKFACELRAISFGQISNLPTIYVCTYPFFRRRYHPIYEKLNCCQWTSPSGIFPGGAWCLVANETVMFYRRSKVKNLQGFSPLSFFMKRITILRQALCEFSVRVIWNILRFH